MSERPIGTISVRDDPDQDRFEARTSEGELAGYVTYNRFPDRIVLVHTEVLPEFEGHGVGSRLARQVLDTVAETGLQVVIGCPFLRAWIERHPDYERR